MKVLTMLTTTFDNKALILGQLWINYKSEDEWVDFFVYNDLGLPLAFAFAEGIINHTPTLEQYVNESFDLLLEAISIEDAGFEDLQALWAACLLNPVDAPHQLTRVYARCHCSISPINSKYIIC